MAMSSIETPAAKAQLSLAFVGMATVCASIISLYSSVTFADAAAPAVETANLDEIIVTGSRQTGIKALDSSAPIQILSPEALKVGSGKPDLMSTLAQIVPSLTQQAYGEDMAGQTLLAKLRGLSPNHVLVLINGKRRHTTANIAIDIGSTFQGGASVDLNFIPLDAIDHIEVLSN